jgi:hypothetical protein
MGCSRRAKLLIFLFSFLIPLTAGLGFLGYLYFSYQGFLPETRGVNRNNALWARHQWVGEKHSPKEYSDFSALLKRNKITDIFVHVGPLDKFGNIPAKKYPFAGAFLLEMKKEYPELRAQAWIGQVEKSAGGPLDISDHTVRGYIVKTAETLLDAGFDGIHYDIEPVRSGNPDFILLLKATSRITRAKNKILSVAAGQLEPMSGVGDMIELFARQASVWKKSYYLEVAKYADQIAVMMYDTQMPSDWLYGNLVKWETKGILKLLGGQTTIFMGVPTYVDTRRKTPTNAENIHSAIRGAIMGLDGIPAGQAEKFGLAVYAEWTTDEKEWQTYRREWLGEKQ